MSSLYRVWPDGTVQDTEDGEAYEWLSDDYRIIEADSPEEALAIAADFGFM